MEKLIKENITYVMLVVMVLIGCLFGIYRFGYSAYDNFNQVSTKKAEKQTKEQKLAQLKAQNAAPAKEKQTLKSGKVIYEVSQLQFSPEASFGIMFENILTNITNTGVRVRSIDYNYQPSEDKVLGTNAEGYNACELSFITVGTYTQLQNFFKSLAREKYLSSLYEVHIEPYDNDKTILIAKFKIRLYTRSV